MKLGCTYFLVWAIMVGGWLLVALLPREVFPVSNGFKGLVFVALVAGFVAMLIKTIREANAQKRSPRRGFSVIQPDDPREK